MSTTNFLYQVENVTKSFTKGGERVAVLDTLSLEVKEGEFISVMGPSGSGKSTLFNLLGGLDRPEKGNIVFLGKNLQKLSNREMDKVRARQIGFIFQFYYLIPVLTAYQNIEMPLLLTSISRGERKKKIETVLSLLGIEGRSKHYPNQLSGGQQQRVAIARAIVSDPAVILADEPTGDLDANNAEEIGKIIKQLNKDFRKTILLFTHDMKIAKLGDRILNMERGKLE